MLTIFSIPKAFIGHIGVIQTNAIRSWLELEPKCEIILFGDDEGTSDKALELGVSHIPGVKCNEFGTPLISDAFEKSQQYSENKILCYTNSDIILTHDLITAIKKVRFKEFLMVGQRWDYDLNDYLDFQNAEWEKDLLVNVLDKGNRHPPTGSDYFVFPRGSQNGFPELAVGRAGWDCWLIYNNRRNGIPVIDASPAVTIVHQNHDYSHVPQRTQKDWDSDEDVRNIDAIGGWDHVFTLLDATHVLYSRYLLPAITTKHIRRRWQTIPVLYPRIAPVAKISQMITKNIVRQLIRRPLRLLMSTPPISTLILSSKRISMKNKVSVILADKDPLKVVVGAGALSYKGWVNTDLPLLDALNYSHWNSIFPKGTIDNIVAEHVIEHWTEEQFQLFLEVIKPFLSKKGIIRLAMPDGHHPDTSYLESVRPGGVGAGADDHKILYDHLKITELTTAKTYGITLLEYFDKNGQFHSFPWDPLDGMVSRSANHDSRNRGRPLTYTSLIVDIWPK